MYVKKQIQGNRCCPVSRTGKPDVVDADSMIGRINENKAAQIALRLFGDVELGTVCSQNARPWMGRTAFTLAELDLEKIVGSVALLITA